MKVCLLARPLSQGERGLRATGCLFESVYFSPSSVVVEENTPPYHWHCHQRIYGCTVARVISDCSEEGLCRKGSVEAPWSSRMAWASLTAADRPVQSHASSPHSPRVWLVEGAVLLKAAGRFKERASKTRRRKGGLFRDLAGFPGDSDGKESTWNAGNLGSTPGLGRSPGEGKGLPTPVFWRIPWTEEPGRLPSMRSQRGRTRLSD